MAKRKPTGTGARRKRSTGTKPSDNRSPNDESSSAENAATVAARRWWLLAVVVAASTAVAFFMGPWTTTIGSGGGESSSSSDVGAMSPSVAVDEKGTDGISSPPSRRNVIVAGYMPEYRSYIDLNAAAGHLTDVILFSVAPKEDGTLAGACCLDGSHYSKGREAREYQRKRRQLKLEATGSEDTSIDEIGGAKDLRVLVSIGGAGRSDSFPILASDPARRKKFLEEIISLCQRERLDGIDFDWESPRSPSDLHVYSVLLGEASRAVRAHGRAGEASLILSVALHPGQFLPPPAYESVDRVHLMTYDMVVPNRGGGGGGGQYSHHATLENSMRAVEALVRDGCPRSKIILGVPAYARHTDNPGDVKTYSEIIDMMKEKGQVPDTSELERRNDFGGYAFDAPADVGRKVDKALKGGLGGVFFWEVGQDWHDRDVALGGMLLGAAAKAAQRLGSDGTSFPGLSNEL